MKKHMATVSAEWALYTEEEKESITREAVASLNEARDTKLFGTHKSNALASADAGKTVTGIAETVSRSHQYAG